MNLPDELLHFLHLLGHSLAARVLLGCLGATLMGLLGRRIALKNISPLPAIILALIALGALVFAFYPPVLNMMVRLDYSFRIRILWASLSLVVLLTTLESLRTSWLEERYALLWVGTSLVILFVAAFPQTIGLLRILSGMNYTSAVIALIFAFLVLVCFHFSIALSQHQNSNELLTREHALLERRVEELEELLKAATPQLPTSPHSASSDEAPAADT